MKTLGFLPVLVLLAAPLAAQGGYLGVALEAPQASAEGEAAVGALIQSVEERSAASFLGLQAGDRVTALDGAPVSTPQQFASQVGARLPGEIVDVTVERDGATLVLSGVLGRRPGMAAAPLPHAPRGQMQPWPQGEAERLQVGQLHRELQEQLRELQGLHGLDGATIIPPLRVDVPQLQMPELEHLFQQPMHFELPQIHMRGMEMPQLEMLFEMPSMELDGDSEVSIRYPASTPEAERQKMIDEAVEKYGEGVDVQFEGEGTRIHIQRRMGAVQPAPPEAPRPVPAPRRNRPGVEEF